MQIFPEINECDAAELIRTEAGTELVKRVPISVAG
jgi:hypothetical protein